MANQDDYYDNDMGENPRSVAEDGGAKEKEDTGYETFLAPKSAFKGDISPGTIHRVKIERALDEELEIRCLGVSKDEPETEDNPQEEESESMY